MELRKFGIWKQPSFINRRKVYNSVLLAVLTEKVFCKESEALLISVDESGFDRSFLWRLSNLQLTQSAIEVAFQFDLSLVLFVLIWASRNIPVI